MTRPDCAAWIAMLDEEIQSTIHRVAVLLRAREAFEETITTLDASAPGQPSPTETTP